MTINEIVDNAVSNLDLDALFDKMQQYNHKCDLCDDNETVFDLDHYYCRSHWKAAIDGYIALQCIFQ